MPGLFGLIAANQGIPVANAFRAMFEPARRHFESEWRSESGEGWALGRTHLNVLQPGRQLAETATVQVLVHGDLKWSGDDQLIGAPASDADRIRACYVERGLDVGEALKGAFCVAIVDPTQRRTLLVSDTLGSYPLYWTVRNDGLVFASELRALLRHPQLETKLDSNAVADYITFGFPFGNKTLAAGVQLLAPGSTLVYEWDARRHRLLTHSRASSAFQSWTGSREEYTHAVVEAFDKAVDDAFSGEHAFGLSLSGGLDSRAILSAVNGQASTLATYTLGVKGCADEVIASRLAGIAGTQHTFFALDERYLRDFLPYLEQMVSLTDGMYLSHGLTEMLALNFLRSAGFNVLLRGHGGELAKTRLAYPLHTDDHVYSLSGAADLVPYLLSRANYISPSLDLGSLFTGTWAAAMRDAARESLTAAVVDVPLSAPDLCGYLYLTEHHRRFTVSSLELFREAVEVRLPFVDARFLSVLLSGRPEWRDDTSLHRALTAAGDRRLLRVRNSNTGAPGNAGPMLEFALDKVNSLFKRLNVHGYRHYHNFQAWMQDQLLASTEALLLSPQSLDRGILRADGVRALIDATREHRADHSYLLQLLLLIELWQRENV